MNKTFTRSLVIMMLLSTNGTLAIRISAPIKPAFPAIPADVVVYPAPKISPVAPTQQPNAPTGNALVQKEPELIKNQENLIPPYVY